MQQLAFCLTKSKHAFKTWLQYFLLRICPFSTLDYPCILTLSEYLRNINEKEYIFFYICFLETEVKLQKKKKKLSNKVVIFDFFMIFLQAILQQNLKELELIVYIIRLNKLLLMWLFLFTFNLLPGVSFLTTQSFSQTMRPTNIGWDKRRHDYIWSMVKKRSKYFEVLIVS